MTDSVNNYLFKASQKEPQIEAAYHKDIRAIKNGTVPQTLDSAAIKNYEDARFLPKDFAEFSKKAIKKVDCNPVEILNGAKKDVPEIMQKLEHIGLGKSALKTLTKIIK